MEYRSLEEFEREWSKVVDAAADRMLDDLEVEARTTWQKRANKTLNATSKFYRTDGLNVARDGDSVVVTVKGGLAAAVDAGSSAFSLVDGFLNPKTKTMNLERAAGVIRWRRVTDKSGRSRRIPIDGGWPAKTGGSWKHPGITPRNITQGAVQEMKRLVIPKLMVAFVERITV